MRFRMLAVLATWFLATAAAAQPPDESPLADAKGVRSYALGLELGRQLRDKLVDVDAATLSRGIADALGEKEPLLTEQEVRAAVAALQADMKRRIAEERTTGAASPRKPVETVRAEDPSSNPTPAQPAAAAQPPSKTAE
jgi:hypothetical protein